ncbi:hypothetical protein PVAP13_4NG232511 [Panicum virgatum]|uniref:Uncharacterized protein n=1 Tax=Panicum virgatum TaxID=38727 RepID=A0A8T0T5E7_PANVG|nr:hypothetical protein PVAP13_4NG232511 [Panicum virgatum]
MQIDPSYQAPRPAWDSPASSPGTCRRSFRILESCAAAAHPKPRRRVCSFISRRDALLLVAQFCRLAALEPDARCPFVSRCAADPSRVASRPPARKSPAPFSPATAPRHRRTCGQEKVRCVEMPPAPSLV